MAKKLSKNTPKKKLQVGDLITVPDGLSGQPTSFSQILGSQEKELLVNNAQPFTGYKTEDQKYWNTTADIQGRKTNDRWKNQFANIKGHDVLQFGLYGVDAMLRKNEAMRNQEAFNRRFRNVLTQAPLYDYNYMYGPDASGGTQYQNLIMAQDGAEIRRTASPNFGDVEVEGGEFIQLPDLSTQHIQGPSHAQGGVHTNLPEGSRVFSDHLKPKGGKKTYAQLAKKYDTEKWEKVLNNAYASEADRNTANLMFKRNQSILNELFADQQIQNGNSDGTDQAQERMSQMPQMPQMQQPPQPQMMGKFGLDLKKGEKLSFTDPFEYGGQYLGGTAEFGYGGMYQDGGMFPFNSTFYGATPGDTSNLTIGTTSKGKPTFQEGGTVEGEKTKNPDKSNPFDNDTVKHFFDSMVEEYGYGVVVDKATNKLYYGKVNWDPEVGESYDVQSFEVLTGQNKNLDIDYQKSMGELEVNPYYRATPLGFFTLSAGTAYGGPSLDLNETLTPRNAAGVAGQIAVHNTYVGPDDMTRAARYNNQNPEDNYVSYGCVNCRPPDLKNLIGFLGSQKNKAQFIINSEKPIEYHKEVFNKNKATFRKPGTNLAANLSVSPKALELYNVEQQHQENKKKIWAELIKDDYIDTEKLEKEIKNPDSPLNTDPKIKQLVTSVVESNAGQGISLPKSAPKGTIAQEAHTKVTQSANLPADASISREYFKESNLKPKGITSTPASASPLPSVPTSVNIPGPQQVEKEAQAKLAAQSDAVILEGAPSNTNPEKLYEDWNWGENYGVDVTTGFPSTAQAPYPSTSPVINADAAAITQNAEAPVTAPAKMTYEEWREAQPKNISNPKLQRMYKEYLASSETPAETQATPPAAPQAIPQAVAQTQPSPQEQTAPGAPAQPTSPATPTAETTVPENVQAKIDAGVPLTEEELYGLRKVEKIKEAYSRDPKYKFRTEDLPQIKEELKVALKEWGIDTKENLEKVDKVNTLNGFTEVAEALQNKVYSSDPELATHYGINEASTLQGLQFLSNKGKISDEELNQITGGDATLKSKITSAQYGSYQNFSPEERQKITQGIKTLPKEKQDEYGKTNFMDKAWFFRRPIIKEVEFKDKKEYDDYVKNVNVGGKYVGQEGEKRGLYIKPIYKGEDPKGEAPKKETTPAETVVYPGSQFAPNKPFQQMPSTPGRMPLYQMAPEALGYLSGLNTYNYYTPDYTHTEIAPPTLNIDPELQSIDDSLQSSIRQSTGNASLDASRKSALFNQALAAKQQAFARKQNFDAQARYQADQYNAQARDLESFRDVSSAAQVYNEYMAGAQDAAERERLSAITSIVNKKAQHDADEFRKIMYFTTMYPNYYYEGTDRLNPVKLNPYANADFYSRTTAKFPGQTTVRLPSAPPEQPEKQTQGPLFTVPVGPPSLPQTPRVSSGRPFYDVNPTEEDQMVLPELSPQILPQATPQMEDVQGLPEDFYPEQRKSSPMRYGGNIFKRR